MKTLTKSLHTVTAVTNVARVVAQLSGGYRTTLTAPRDARALVREALAILDYDAAEFAADDPTIAACIKAVAKALKVAP